MNTPGHIVINLIFAKKKGKEKYLLPLALGGLLPDLPIFFFYAYEKIVLKADELLIWSIDYFLPKYQMIFDSFHSIPLFAVAYLLAYRFKADWLSYLFLGFLIHSFIDLPLHNDDAHSHFFPLTDWKFLSPVSYWDPKHYGIAGTIGETFIVLIASIYILTWCKKRWVIITIIIVNTLYLIGMATHIVYYNKEWLR